MTNAVDVEVNPGTTSQRVTLFYLNDSGITAASSTTISVSNSVTASISIHAASYQDAMQTTPTNTDTDTSTAATPNPLAACDIVTGAADAVVVALSGCGNSTTATWGGTLTERTDQTANATAAGSLADDSVPTATTIACDCTWASQNRAAICALELEHDAGVGITTVTPSEFDMDTASVTIAGTGFGSTIGASDVYLSPNDLLSEAGEVDITTAVNTWSDTSINLDLSTLSAGVLADLHTMGPGARFLIVNVGGTPGTTEYFSAVTLHRPVAFVMSLSTEFAPGSTTARLTGLTGTFAGGRIEEALNPSTTNTNVASDGNREDVWNIQATTESREVAYVGRVLYGGVVADTITQTPTITISAATEYTIDAASGSYAWTGTAANLEYHVVMDAASGSYAWTGTAANLEYNVALAVDSGSYSWTGTAASLELGALVSAESGSYAWTGAAANLELNSIFDVESGSYAWTGTAASLELHTVLDAEATSYAWSGQDATLTYIQTATLVAGTGAYVWTGTASDLLLQALVSAESGSYAWTGTAADLLRGFTVSAEAGAYSWAGQAASLEFGALVSAESGSYAWTGTDAGFLYDVILTAEAASYTWTGQEATFLQDFALAADTTSYVWTGQTATLIFDALVSAEAAAYIWSGQDVDLIYAQQNTMVAGAGSYLWTGTDAGFLYDRIMNAESGSYLWTGASATLTYTIPGAPSVVPYIGQVVNIGDLMNR
jgi:hypothetical protein